MAVHMRIQHRDETDHESQIRHPRTLTPTHPGPGLLQVDIRLSGKGNSNSHGARPVHQITSMIKWIRTSRLAINNSLSLQDVVIGKIYFLLVRLKIKHMEIEIRKRESTGSGSDLYNESETITKFEVRTL